MKASILHKRPVLIGALAGALVAFALVLSFTGVARASFASWGDTSLIHGCEDPRGRVTLVDSSESCKTNETQITWIKDVDAGEGLTASRTSDGVTLSLDSSQGIARYESGGSGFGPPNGTWQDVSALAITASFDEGTIKATFAGSIVQSNGDGTAYVRLKVQKTGQSASYVGDVTIYRSSSASASEISNAGFTTQKVVSVESGEYTVTPQVNINNSSWGLFYQNSLIVEQ